jgi:hypothetical protein
MFNRIFSYLKPARRLTTKQQLQDFIESRSAYLVQKSITEYAQARANMMFSTLLGEKGFQDAYEAARWKSFPAGLSMVCEMALSELRKSNADTKNSADLILAIAKTIVSQYSVPTGQQDTFWATALLSLKADLGRAILSASKEVHAIVQPRAKEVFDALPFHASIRSHDFPMFRNTLAFHLTEIAGELEEMEIAPTLT